MPDFYAFADRDGHAAGNCAVISRLQDGSGVFALACGNDSDCVAETLAARWRAEEPIADLPAQADGETEIALLALSDGKVSWAAAGGAKLLRFRGNEPAAEEDGETALTDGDAFLLCSSSAWEHLSEEAAQIDLLKANDAREWAELLLLRIMERLPNAPAPLSLLTVRITA